MPLSHAPSARTLTRHAALQAERSRPSLTQRRRRRPRGRRILAVAATTFAFASIVATSIPSALFTPSGPATTTAAVASAAIPIAAASPQAYVVADTPDSVVIRDNFAAAAAPARVVEVSAETGATVATTSSSTGSIRWPFPTQVRTSDGFGPRAAPCSGCSTNHKGLDMLPGEGTPIGVVADGVVRETGETDEGFGNYAVVDHVVDGDLVSTLYAHMQWGSLAVSEGQPVKAGQILGNVGSTGMSTGPHLHLEVWQDGVDPVDPAAWLSRNAG